jgi:hypothetical protein
LDSGQRVAHLKGFRGANIFELYGQTGGETVGLEVGSSVGAGMIISEGTTVGLSEGDSVTGARVGFFVGFLVGFLVGLFTGAFVGTGQQGISHPPFMTSIGSVMSLKTQKSVQYIDFFPFFLSLLEQTGRQLSGKGLPSVGQGTLHESSS